MELRERFGFAQQNFVDSVLRVRLELVVICVCLGCQTKQHSLLILCPVMPSTCPLIQRLAKLEHGDRRERDDLLEEEHQNLKDYMKKLDAIQVSAMHLDLLAADAYDCMRWVSILPVQFR